LVRDGEKFKGGFAGAAGALLPAFYGVEAYVDYLRKAKAPSCRGLMKLSYLTELVREANLG
jgi:hypothetical protein